MKSKILISCFMILGLVSLLSASSLALTGTGNSTADAQAIRAAVNAAGTEPIVVQLSGTFNLGDDGANGPREIIRFKRPNVTIQGPATINGGGSFDPFLSAGLNKRHQSVFVFDALGSAYPAYAAYGFSVADNCKVRDLTFDGSKGIIICLIYGNGFECERVKITNAVPGIWAPTLPAPDVTEGIGFYIIGTGGKLIIKDCEYSTNLDPNVVTPAYFIGEQGINVWKGHPTVASDIQIINNTINIDPRNRTRSTPNPESNSELVWYTCSGIAVQGISKAASHIQVEDNKILAAQIGLQIQDNSCPAEISRNTMNIYPVASDSVVKLFPIGIIAVNNQTIPQNIYVISNNEISLNDATTGIYSWSLYNSIIADNKITGSLTQDPELSGAGVLFESGEKNTFLGNNLSTLNRDSLPTYYFDVSTVKNMIKKYSDKCDTICDKGINNRVPQCFSLAGRCELGERTRNMLSNPPKQPDPFTLPNN